MDKYLKKAEILTQHFNMYGYGNFDLTLEEVATILELLENSRELKSNLNQLYEKLENQRLG